ISAHPRAAIGLHAVDGFFGGGRGIALRAAPGPDEDADRKQAEHAHARHAGLMPGRRARSKVEHLVRFRPEVYLAGVPALLEVRGLETQFATDEGVVRAVDRVSFSIEAGK